MFKHFSPYDKVIDVYQAWCGLCSGMIGSFRKYRLDIDDELLLLYAVSKKNLALFNSRL
jgi:hypothetical protein